ncbi:MAG: OB-fold nucleic acid binding domain-containing protein [Nanoarchaeota archaeon]
MQQRQTAHKLWIAHILSSPYTKTTEEFTPHYITFKDMQISRVNIIANVIETFVNPEATLASVTLDDGSGTIRMRAFKDNITIVKDIEMGDLILVIGKVREYNNEVYIVPDIVKKISNPAWSKLRRLELLKEHGQPSPIQQQVPQRMQEETSMPMIQISTIAAPVSERAQEVLSYIEKSEEGIAPSALMSSLNLPQQEIERIILELLKNSDIYQNKPGHYKIL